MLRKGLDRHEIWYIMVASGEVEDIVVFPAQHHKIWRMEYLLVVFPLPPETAANRHWFTSFQGFVRGCIQTNRASEILLSPVLLLCPAEQPSSGFELIW